MAKGGKAGGGRSGGTKSHGVKSHGVKSHSHSHSHGHSHGHSFGKSFNKGPSIHHRHSSYGRSRFGSSRFGRSGFGSRRNRYIGGRRYRSYGYGSSRDAVAYYEQQMDQVYNSSLAPVFINGSLTLYGKDSTITNQLNSFQPAVLVQYQQVPNLTQMMAQPIYQEMAMAQYFPNGIYPDEVQL